jgi:hypothetical protein
MKMVIFLSTGAANVFTFSKKDFSGKINFRKVPESVIPRIKETAKR